VHAGQRHDALLVGGVEQEQHAAAPDRLDVAGNGSDPSTPTTPAEAAARATIASSTGCGGTSDVPGLAPDAARRRSTAGEPSRSPVNVATASPSSRAAVRPHVRGEIAEHRGAHAQPGVGSGQYPRPTRDQVRERNGEPAEPDVGVGIRDPGERPSTSTPPRSTTPRRLRASGSSTRNSCGATTRS